MRFFITAAASAILAISFANPAHAQTRIDKTKEIEKKFSKKDLLNKTFVKKPVEPPVKPIIKLLQTNKTLKDMNLVTHFYGGNHFYYLNQSSSKVSKKIPTNYLESRWKVGWIYEIGPGFSEVKSSDPNVELKLLPSDCVKKNKPPKVQTKQACTKSSLTHLLVKTKEKSERKVIEAKLIAQTTNKSMPINITVARSLPLTVVSVTDLASNKSIPVEDFFESSMKFAKVNDSRKFSPTYRIQFNESQLTGMNFRSKGGCALPKVANLSERITNIQHSGDILNQVRASSSINIQFDARGASFGSSVVNSGVVNNISDLPNSNCKIFLIDEELTASLSQKGGVNTLTTYSVLSPTQTIVRNIRPSFLSVAGFGDSYASGEGAPDAFNATSKVARWEEPQCHRSYKSPFAKAVLKITEAEGVWVLFKNFACSGAKIHEGILGQYRGKKVNGEYQEDLIPQIDQAEAWKAENGLEQIDAALLNIGGNDVGFFSVALGCLAPNFIEAIQIIRSCDQIESLLYHIQNGGSWDVSDYLWDIQDDIEEFWFREDLEANIGDTTIGLSNLPEAYSELADELESLGVNETFITELPSPFNISPNSFCPSGNSSDPLHGRVSGSEIRWVNDNVFVPLNRAISSAASANDWNLVNGVVDHHLRNGFCYIERFSNTLTDSFIRVQGDHEGVLHPNNKGFNVTGEVVAKKLATFYNLPLDKTTQVMDTFSTYDNNREYDRRDSAIPYVGDYIDHGAAVKILFDAGPHDFYVQLMPTRRQINATLSIKEFDYRSGELTRDEVFRGNRNSEYYQSASSASPSIYSANVNLNACKRVEYQWEIVSQGDNTLSHTVSSETREFTVHCN